MRKSLNFCSKLRMSRKRRPCRRYGKNGFGTLCSMPRRRFFLLPESPGRNENRELRSSLSKYFGNYIATLLPKEVMYRLLLLSAVVSRPVAAFTDWTLP